MALPFTKMLQTKHEDLSFMSLLTPDIHFINLYMARLQHVSLSQLLLLTSLFQS